MRVEAAALRRDIAEARVLIDRHSAVTSVKQKRAATA
jgi:hypothetical protein